MHRKVTLPNGIRVVTEEVPVVHSAAVGVWIRCGSRYERDDECGLSHFLEHMFFKGTGKRSAKEIAEELDAVGGHLNAFTTKEFTCIYAKVLNEHLPLAIDVLSDMLFNSNFAESDIEKEKRVVLEEIKMFDDAPDERIHDVFSETILAGHPLGRPILGSVQSITSLKRQQIIDYYHRHYLPDNIVLAVSGNISHAQVVDQLGNVFGGCAGHSTGQILMPPQYHAQQRNLQKDTEQLQICLGVPGLPQEHDDIFALHIMNNILGGGISSRLFQTVREERGLAYSIFSYHSAYLDSGLFSVYAGTSPENFGELVAIILAELSSIKSNGVSLQELQRTKDQIKGNLLLSMENISTRMSRLGKSELCHGKVITAEEVVEKITRVKLDDVHRLADSLFSGDKLSLATIGQLDTTEMWKRLLGASGL